MISTPQPLCYEPIEAPLTLFRTCTSAITSSTVLGFAVDLDARTIQFYKNGVACTGALSVANFAAGTYYPTAMPYQTTNSVTMNFGPTFPFGVPSGYNAGWYL